MDSTTITKRLDELIAEGEWIFAEFKKNPKGPIEPVRFARWVTSSLNLLDKLSLSTNRFVREFEQ